MSDRKKFGSSVVLGSGIAGLVSACALAEYFDKVTVIEKDPEPSTAGFRSGTPQGRHFHALIAGGLEIMEHFLPGLKEQLRDAGSLLPEPGQFYFYMPQGKSYSQGAYQPEVPAIDTWQPPYIQTRGLLEYTIRCRVAALENVHFVYDTAVKELLWEDRRVVGVKLEKDGSHLNADLVIDALGKSGRTLGWLKEMGYDCPDEDVINCDFAYTSVFMQPDDPKSFTDVGYFVAPNPESGHHRGAALVKMEDESWITLVGGRYGDFPPRDFEGFMAYAETTAEPRFVEMLKQAKPIGEPAHYRFPNGIRRRFDRLNDFPEGLLPIGDSVCHFNPAYGQGMSSASRQALGLHSRLGAIQANGSLAGLWREVLPTLYQETRAPWLFAAMADFGHPSCTGDFPNEESAVLEEMGRLMEAAKTGDQAAGTLLNKVYSLQAPLSDVEKERDSTQVA